MENNKRRRGGSKETTAESSRKKKKTVESSRKKEKTVEGSRKKKKSNRERENEVSRFAFRAGFGLLCELFVGEKKLVLNGKQQGLLATTPFWNLLQVFINNQITINELGRPNAEIKKLTDTYKHLKDRKGGFLVRKEEGFEPTPEEMALIFGMQILENGIQDLLETRLVCPGKNDLCKKYFGGDQCTELTNIKVKSAILTSAQGNDEEEFVRLLVLYLCCVVFFTKTGGSSLPCSYLVLVESIDVINSISWPHLIHKHLMDSIEKSNGDYKKITGCAFYFLYWYAERSNNLIKKRENHETSFPRFMRWSLQTISKTIHTFKSSSFTNIKPNFGSQVENDSEKTLITPFYVKSQVEKLQEKITELQNEVNDQRQKQMVVNVKLCEIQKILREDPEAMEVVRKILEDLLKQSKEQPQREQENEDSHPHTEQEHTNVSGSQNERHPNSRKPAQENKDTNQQHQNNQQNEPHLQQENNKKKRDLLDMELGIEMKQKQKKEDERVKQDLLAKELARKEKEAEEQKIRVTHEKLKEEERVQQDQLAKEELARKEEVEQKIREMLEKINEKEERAKQDLLAKTELARKEEEEQKQRELQEERERAKKIRKENLDRKTQERQKERVKELREGHTRENEKAAERDQILQEVKISIQETLWGCNDLASVLRRLGFSVPPSATTKEILNVAKKAQFKFHPDRLTNFNLPLYERIEAQEKTKIIQDMKKHLESGH